MEKGNGADKEYTEPLDINMEEDIEEQYPDINEGGDVTRIDQKREQAPMLKFGPIFQAWHPLKKIDYLMKLSSSVYACSIQIEKERDELLVIAGDKENKIRSQQEQINNTTAILQQRLQISNKEKQERDARIEELKTQVRELESDSNIS